MKYILLLVIILGCTKVKTNRKPTAESPFKMKCAAISSNIFRIYRCENKEVVCYTDQSGFTCDHKGLLNMTRKGEK